MDKEPEKEGGRNELDYKVTKRNRPLTITASTPEQKITQEGNIIIPGQPMVTCGTMGPGFNYRFFPWQAPDTDVQKAPHTSS